MGASGILSVLLSRKISKFESASIWRITSSNCSSGHFTSRLIMKTRANSSMSPPTDLFCQLKM